MEVAFNKPKILESRRLRLVSQKKKKKKKTMTGDMNENEIFALEKFFKSRGKLFYVDTICFVKHNYKVDIFKLMDSQISQLIW